MLRATKPYGPFPRPSLQLGRYQLSDDVLAERARRWVELRRHGHTATSIAATEGVAHQYVSRATRDHGPYPAPEVIQGWVEERRLGRTLSTIADKAGVPESTTRRETAPFGPFRAPGHPLPDGVEGVSTIAKRAGVSSATVMHWRDSGRLPDPDFITAAGRQLWLPSTIDQWLQETSSRPAMPVGRGACPRPISGLRLIAREVNAL